MRCSILQALLFASLDDAQSFLVKKVSKTFLVLAIFSTISEPCELRRKNLLSSSTASHFFKSHLSQVLQLPGVISSFFAISTALAYQLSFIRESIANK